MSEQMYLQQTELANIIKRKTDQNGVSLTDIPSLFFINRTSVTEPFHGVYKPSFCLIIQGEKEVFLAKERYVYSPADYLVASVNVPVTGQVIKASTETPYIALKLEFTPSQILEILDETKIQVGLEKKSSRAIFVSKVEESLLDAVVRLVRLVDTPNDISILAPIFKKEILYRILQGPHGSALKQMAIEGSETYRIREVMSYIMNNFEKSFRIDELAELAKMSVSSLHRHFKEISAMSPIQFQKQLRLQEARRLLLLESTDAAEVSFRVGYESPSQFSREYSRMFGLPPREDMKRMRKNHDYKINA
ncbi:AraC family transcriptional regulator [Metabacillus niabensis]|uniref:AraC family transcriptional regulator n=1 Tax=Metabacillus niabensis TaxID=324854 RepID=UPI001CFBB952|nr:AraC family transcriptional regulator [Metabacillus niabensis]